ncbi:hypothetical protein CPB83DRAFT_862289 [Crepidotus variabilis]|uniref:F-box domain-containing protein n=1 Tax=Crepidotus variabilis TaxID=179855 RepID=A0A9P6JKH9_9AGAR|nr:hypothetical protein CPB83DRAFT_862289 [Crepidotus variabilis]
MALSKMHRCLRTPELLLNIFQQIRYDGGPKELGLNQSTLAALARTCKDFKEPALDTLWYSMDSFLPLLRCLPSHALEINVVRTERSRIRVPYPKISVRESLQSDDFSRLLYYAPRIRVFHLDQSVYATGPPDPFIDESAYERLLSAKSTSGPLLPNIKRLTLPLAHLIGSSPIPQLIVGSQLQHLGISGTCENTIDRVNWEDFSRLLDSANVRLSLVNLSISLVDVYGYLTPFYVSCPTKFLSILAGSRQLSKLDLESFRVKDAGTVAMLGLVPNLRILTLNLDLERLGQLKEAPADQLGYFCSLTQIKLITSSAAAVCDFFSQSKSSRLEVVVIERFCRSSFWEIPELLSTIARYLPCPTLRCITLCNGIDPFLTRQYNHNTSDLSFDSLKQLFCFTKLEKLCINLGAKVSLRDSDLAEISNAWPSMRHFELYEREFSERSKITPNGIYSFVKSLARLRHLTIRFNASGTSTYPKLPDVQHHRLRYLDVCTSDADESAPIVPFVERLFPLLEYLRWGWVYEHPQIPGSGWETRLEDEEEQIKNDDSHECWISTFERLGLPRLKRST